MTNKNPTQADLRSLSRVKHQRGRRCTAMMSNTTGSVNEDGEILEV